MLQLLEHKILTMLRGDRADNAFNSVIEQTCRMVNDPTARKYAGMFRISISYIPTHLHFFFLRQVWFGHCERYLGR